MVPEYHSVLYIAHVIHRGGSIVPLFMSWMQLEDTFHVILVPDCPFHFESRVQVKPGSLPVRQLQPQVRWKDVLAAALHISDGHK